MHNSVEKNDFTLTSDCANYLNVITNIWFGAEVESLRSVREAADLTPYGALCLLIMATESAACGNKIAMYLHPAFGANFDKTEAAILIEEALYSLESIGYLRLDAQGKQELEEHRKENDKYYGLGDVQWHLTSKAAKRIAPAYCACKKLPSSEQEQARKDIIAANKAEIKSFRKAKSAREAANKKWLSAQVKAKAS